MSKWSRLIQCSKFPHIYIHCVLSVLGACNKRCNNPQHVIDTSDSRPDLERAVAIKMSYSRGNQMKFKCKVENHTLYGKLNGGYLEGNALELF